MALEATGMVITALSAPAVIRGLFNQDSDPLWGIFSRVSGGLTGQVILLGFSALVGAVFGGWAHTRQKAASDRAADPGGVHGRGAA
ncbi:hypothetical protein ACFPA8_23100 [Streptomyces ovatisporus]|uniref:Integral membrane protein n=1 Tax=Streptomyces ovatisporus TaxID=1128682 RepID=A0ABV9AF70_9ACTN